MSTIHLRHVVVTKAAPAVDNAALRRGRAITGALFLVTGEVHLGIVAAGTGFYTISLTTACSRSSVTGGPRCSCPARCSADWA